MVTKGATEKPTTLVVTRREREGIIATLEDGREIRFVIQHIHGQGASVSITAPRSIGLLRDELEGLPRSPRGAA